jgi:sec-independent protein translocase protein TatA
MFAFLDPPEIILIVVVILVLFGGSQLPKLAKNLGKAQQEFKAGLSEGQKDAEREKAAGTTKPDAATDSTSSE